MSDGTLNRSVVQTILDDVGDGEWTIREDYSGRGMYGATCFALTGPPRSAFLMIGALAVALEDNGADWPSLLQDAREDSMGRDIVIYFPGWNIDDVDEA